MPIPWTSRPLNYVTMVDLWLVAACVACSPLGLVHKVTRFDEQQSGCAELASSRRQRTSRWTSCTSKYIL